MLFYTMSMLKNLETVFLALSAIACVNEDWINSVISFPSVTDEEVDQILDSLKNNQIIASKCILKDKTVNASNKLDVIFEETGCCDYEDCFSFNKILVVAAIMANISEPVREIIFAKLSRLHLTLDNPLEYDCVSNCEEAIQFLRNTQDRYSYQESLSICTCHR